VTLPTTRGDNNVDVQPTKPTNRGPQDWFTGEVWIDPITAGHGPHQLSLGNVRFAPGARTAWHSHSIAQTLHVTEGEGLVQARGEAVIKIRPGNVVNVAGDEWHWHGATPDHFMTHLSLTEGDTEWGEQVTDAEYQSK
jgi:quercetin dioxygenase-like cupin family protein